MTGSSLYLWLKESNIIVTGALQQSISFAGPQYVVHQLRPWQNFNSLLVHSPGVSINAYTRIISNNKSLLNGVILKFPSLTDSKQTSNPLRNTMAITIPSEELANYNCYNELEVDCLLTITLLPDTTRIYYPDSLKQSKAHVSGNTFELRLVLNYPHNVVEEGVGVNYFRCNVTGYSQDEFIVSVTTESHCRPAIYQGNELNRATPVYGVTTLRKQDNWLNFTVMNE